MTIRGSLTPCLLMTLTLALPNPVPAQESPQRIGTATITYASGGSVKIISRSGIGSVSGDSDLELEWIMVNDSSLGLVFDEAVGARGIMDGEWFRYAVNMKMRAVAPVRAFEVRVLTFNVWRDFTGTLSFTELEELESGEQRAFDRKWGLYGESRLRAHQTSVAYVAKVMLGDGTVMSADPTPALTIAQRLQESVTLQDLEPEVEPVGGPIAF